MSATEEKGWLLVKSEREERERELGEPVKSIYCHRNILGPLTWSFTEVIEHVINGGVFNEPEKAKCAYLQLLTLSHTLSLHLSVFQRVPYNFTCHLKENKCDCHVIP